MLEQIRKIMNGKTISGKSSNVSAIINATIRQSESDSNITSFIDSLIEKGKITKKEIIETAEKESKKLSRTKHTFNSLNEYRDFAQNNECGSIWEEDGKFCVYKY